MLFKGFYKSEAVRVRCVVFLVFVIYHFVPGHIFVRSAHFEPCIAVKSAQLEIVVFASPPPVLITVAVYFFKSDVGEGRDAAEKTVIQYIIVPFVDPGRVMSRIISAFVQVCIIFGNEIDVVEEKTTEPIRQC